MEKNGKTMEKDGNNYGTQMTKSMEKRWKQLWNTKETKHGQNGTNYGHKMEKTMKQTQNLWRNMEPTIKQRWNKTWKTTMEKDSNNYGPQMKKLWKKWQ